MSVEINSCAKKQNTVHKVRTEKRGVIWTQITGHGWDEHKTDSTCHNNNAKQHGMDAKQHGIAKATLAQYNNHGGDDQKGTITKHHLLSYNLVLPRAKIVSRISNTETRPSLTHQIHMNDSI